MLGVFLLKGLWTTRLRSNGLLDALLLRLQLGHRLPIITVAASVSKESIASRLLLGDNPSA